MRKRELSGGMLENQMLVASETSVCTVIDPSANFTAGMPRTTYSSSFIKLRALKQSARDMELGSQSSSSARACSGRYSFSTSKAGLPSIS
jgi:hypothetical protein